MAFEGGTIRQTRTTAGVSLKISKKFTISGSEFYFSIPRASKIK